MYTRNLNLNRFFCIQYPFVFVLAGREYQMDIVLSKNGVKCAVFKISEIFIKYYDASSIPEKPHIDEIS